MAFSFKKAFDFDGCHAAGPGGGNGLPVAAVLDIAGVKDPGDAGACAAFGEDVTIRVELDLPDERSGIRNVPDGDKEAVYVAHPAFAGDDVAQLHRSHDILAGVKDILDDG